MKIIIIIILIICTIVIALYLAKRTPKLVGAFAPHRFGAHRSHLEERLIAIVEELTGQSFPQSHIRASHRAGKSLELDGYNAELKLAIEVQGPLHRAQGEHESYQKYTRRIANDKLKKILCEEQGITLIVLEYDILSNRFNDVGARNYIASRLFDAGAITECPREYTPEQKISPWTRETI